MFGQRAFNSAQLTINSLLDKRISQMHKFVIEQDDVIRRQSQRIYLLEDRLGSLEERLSALESKSK